MKKIYAAILFVLLFAGSVRAQYVTIPDSNFVKFLKGKYPTCMNGNQMDTTCSGVVNATVVTCNFANLTDLTGIQYFDKLKTLGCYGNKITNLSILPPKLEILGCEQNELTILPKLPSTLKNLGCNVNKLTVLPALPQGLGLLFCEGNLLTALPVLPSTITRLNCARNLLTSLPVLPAGLKELYCSANPLGSLPSPLPSTLEVLWCTEDNLTALPALPITVVDLICDNNKLTSLPSLPPNLERLDCGENLLTVLPALPSTIELIDCNTNKLTKLPVLPAALTYLTCRFNKLDSLPSFPLMLTDIFCDSNQIKTLPTLPAVIQRFTGAYNNLSVLPVFPDSISAFDVSYNPKLVCAPPFKKVYGSRFFQVEGTGITCLQAPIQHTGYIASIDTMPICGPCSAPLIHMGKITSATATVVWNGQCGIYNYHVQYRKKGTTAWTTLIAGANAIYKILNSLSPATQYEVRANTTCSPGNSTAWSAIQTFTTLSSCIQPAGITLTNIKKDRVTVSWGTVTGAYSYQVRYRPQGTGTWATKIIIAPATSRIITGLTNNTIYEYQLITICDPSGKPKSTWTTTQTFTTLLRMEEGEVPTDFTLYPNPASGELRITNADFRMGDEFFITDLTGRHLITQHISQSASLTRIDVSSLTPGVYFITLQSKGGSAVKKFVKQ